MSVVRLASGSCWLLGIHGEQLENGCCPLPRIYGASALLSLLRKMPVWSMSKSVPLVPDSFTQYLYTQSTFHYQKPSTSTSSRSCFAGTAPHPAGSCSAGEALGILLSAGGEERVKKRSSPHAGRWRVALSRSSLMGASVSGCAVGAAPIWLTDAPCCSSAAKRFVKVWFAVWMCRGSIDLCQVSFPCLLCFIMERVLLSLVSCLPPHTGAGL